MKNVQRQWIAIGLAAVALVALGIYLLTTRSSGQANCTATPATSKTKPCAPKPTP